MPLFDNIGHRERLQQLGILQPDETELSSAELVARLFDHPRVLEETLSILRQDILQPITVYGMLDSVMEMAMIAAERITDPETLQNAIQNMTHLAQIPLMATQRATELQEFVSIFRSQFKLDETLGLSEAAEKDLERIYTNSDKLIQMVQAAQPKIHLTLRQINDLIHQKSQTL